VTGVGAKAYRAQAVEAALAGSNLDEQAIAAVKSGAIACFDKSRLVNDADRFVKVLRRVVGARDKAAA